MKTTGVLPEALAASISRFSRSEIAAVPDSGLVAVVLISSSCRLGGHLDDLGAACVVCRGPGSLDPGRSRIRRDASASR